MIENESRYSLHEAHGTQIVDDSYNEMPHIMFHNKDQATKFLNHLQGYEQLKETLSQIENVINNQIEEKVGYAYALKQLKKKLIREGLLFVNEKEGCS